MAPLSVMHHAATKLLSREPGPPPSRGRILIMYNLRPRQGKEKAPEAREAATRDRKAGLGLKLLIYPALSEKKLLANLLPDNFLGTII